MLQTISSVNKKIESPTTSRVLTVQTEYLDTIFQQIEIETLEVK